MMNISVNNSKILEIKDKLLLVLENSMQLQLQIKNQRKMFFNSKPMLMLLVKRKLQILWTTMISLTQLLVAFSQLNL